jgi:hypothetical protein
MIDVPRPPGRAFRIDQRGKVENAEVSVECGYLHRSVEALVVIPHAFDDIEQVDHPLSRNQRHERRYADLALIHKEGQALFDSARVCFPQAKQGGKKFEICRRCRLADIYIVGDSSRSVRCSGKPADYNEFDALFVEPTKDRRETH